MSVIMYRLKQNGRAAVILPDGFLFGTDNAKIAIKEKLLSEFNLHTIIRMPHSVFAPYTSITTNILFFDRTHPTTETWFYRLDMPEGYKNFSKTKPMKLEHFAPAVEWWDNREEITIGGFDKAKKYSVEELKARNYNIDLCGYPHEEEEILPPKELILQYQEKRASLNADIDRILPRSPISLALTLRRRPPNDCAATEKLHSPDGCSGQACAAGSQMTNPLAFCWNASMQRKSGSSKRRKSSAKRTPPSSSKVPIILLMRKSAMKCGRWQMRCRSTSPIRGSGCG